MTTSTTAPRMRPFEVALPPHPYPGLRPFEKGEWPIFFGRERNTAEVVDRLIDKQFVALHGDSGCGKSSLIRAGVIPRLESDHARGGVTWRTSSMLPRNAPLRNLSLALASLDADPPSTDFVTDVRRILNLGERAAERLSAKLRRGDRDYMCVLIDQFEEIFQFADQGGQSEAQQFIDVLIGLQQTPAQGLHIVLTMRSEFIGACARYEGLAEAFNATQFLLPRMDHQALIRALREPARLYHGEVELELAEVLISESGRGQDQLPLMQHAMMLLQRRATRHATVVSDGPSWVLGLADYRSTGGVTRLLTEHANGVAGELSAGGSDSRGIRNDQIVERTFKALTTVNADGHGIRRPRSIAQLMAVTGASRQELLTVLEPLTADGVSFLKIFGRKPFNDTELVDISHEALIRNWDRLKLWMVEEKKFRVWHEEVKRHFADWVAAASRRRDQEFDIEIARKLLASRRASPADAAVGDNALLLGLRLDQAKHWLKANPEMIEPELNEYVRVSELVQIASARLIDSRSDGSSTTTAASDLNVFIMYSRVDLQFVDELVQALELGGVRVMLDRADISKGEEWTQRLSSLIRSADTILFAISPASVSSQVCRWEIEEAIKYGKRILPIVAKHTDPAQIPDPLKSLNYIDFSGGGQASSDTLPHSTMRCELM